MENAKTRMFKPEEGAIYLKTFLMATLILINAHSKLHIN